MSTASAIRTEPDRPALQAATTSTLVRWAPAILAAATAAAISIPRLDRRPVWLDEAYTVGATRDLVATWRGSGGTQAVYYLLMWPVTQLSIAPTWIRLPSLLAAVATVVVVYDIGRRLGGWWMGTVAAATLACTASLSRFAIEARSYSLAMLLISLSWLGLVAAAQADDEGSRRRWLRLWAVSLLLAPLAHGMAALHFVSQLAVLAASPDRRRWLQACVPVAAGLGVEGLLLFGLGAGEVADWVAPLNRGQVEGVWHLLVGRSTIGLLVGAVALLGAVAGIRRARLDDNGWVQLVPMAWFLGAPLLLIALSVVRPYGVARYVLGSLPALGLLVGRVVAEVPRRSLQIAATAAVCLALLVGHGRVTGAYTENWPGLMSTLQAHADEGERVMTPAEYRTVFDYWWDRQHAPPELRALSPTEPLGDIQRFYDAAPGTLRDRLLADTSTTVWYVDRGPHGKERTGELVGNPQLRDAYRITPWSFRGDLFLLRFDPR